MPMKRVKARQDFGLLNVAANEGLENGVTLGARKLAFDPIMGVSASQSFTPPLHFRNADFRLGFRLRFNRKIAHWVPSYRLARGEKR
jgi:hypothetical protein